MGRFRGSIGRYFTWDELVPDHLQAKLRPADIVALRNLVWYLLDPLRGALGRPVIVTSGFRDEELNKQVGGAEFSQHLYGEAADITVPGEKIEIVVEAVTAFDPFKLGIYSQHIHLSIPSRDLLHHATPATWESDDA